MSITDRIKRAASLTPGRARGARSGAAIANVCQP
jgi:hypothetical protein